MAKKNINILRTRQLFVISHVYLRSFLEKFVYNGPLTIIPTFKFATIFFMLPANVLI